MEAYISKCTKNHVHKLFALIDEAVTWDLSTAPWEKNKEHIKQLLSK